MATRTPQPPTRTLNRPDPDEAAWRGAWQAAYDHNAAALGRFRDELDDARRRGRAGEQVTVVAPELRAAPSLPEFGARRVSSATRELLGRYLHDRDTNLVHDCYAAGETCAIDEIHNGTFVHFGGELDAYLAPEAVACGCMAEES